MFSTSLPSISSRRTGPDHSVCRMRSASRVEYNDLLSRRRELQTLLSNIREENGLILSQQTRILDAISSFKYGELSHITEKHNDDVQMLNEKIRVQNREIWKIDQKLMKKEMLLRQTQDALRQSKALVDDGELEDLDQLTARWSEVLNKLTSKDLEIKELQDKAQAVVANHKSVICKKQANSKELEAQSKKLSENIQQLQIKIKAADRELANSLIYKHSELTASQSSPNSNQVARQPHRIQTMSLVPLQNQFLEKHTENPASKQVKSGGKQVKSGGKQKESGGKPARKDGLVQVNDSQQQTKSRAQEDELEKKRLKREEKKRAKGISE